MSQQQAHQQIFSPETMSARLSHVRWIGGGSGAAKTTVARQLADDYRLRLYSTDDTMTAHASRSSPSDAPLLHAFRAMDMDERWVNRSPTAMFQTFHWFQGEGFALILDDLLALPQEPLIVAEGFRLLPRLVMPLLSQTNQAIWLAPTPEFRRAAFESRGSLWEIAKKTNHPEQALSNLLERDQIFTDEVVTEAAAPHLRVIKVDGTLNVEGLTQLVAARLGLGTR